MSPKTLIRRIGTLVMLVIAIAITLQEPPVSLSPSVNAQVTRVIDGDTLVVDIEGEEMKVRLIGVNTPETVDPRRPVECFGAEASAQAHELLENQSIVLISDDTQGDVDKYDRLLRYVELNDGTDVGRELISQGYAYEYTYDDPYARQSDYRLAQQEAEQAGRGLWANNACK
jgi:micrococcal nuclease